MCKQVESEMACSNGVVRVWNYKENAEVALWLVRMRKRMQM